MRQPILASLGAALVIACGPSAPLPTHPTDATLVSRDTWVAYPQPTGNRPDAGSDDATPSCDAVPAPASCQGVWLTDVLDLGPSGGTILAVYATPSAYWIEAAATRGCGIPQSSPNWRLALPLPRRAVRLSTAQPPACSGQP